MSIPLLHAILLHPAPCTLLGTTASLVVQEGRAPIPSLRPFRPHSAGGGGGASYNVLLMGCIRSLAFIGSSPSL